MTDKGEGGNPGDMSATSGIVFEHRAEISATSAVQLSEALLPSSSDEFQKLGERIEALPQEIKRLLMEGELTAAQADVEVPDGGIVGSPGADMDAVVKIYAEELYQKEQLTVQRDREDSIRREQHEREDAAAASERPRRGIVA